MSFVFDFLNKKYIKYNVQSKLKKNSQIQHHSEDNEIAQKIINIYKYGVKVFTVSEKYCFNNIANNLRCKDDIFWVDMNNVKQNSLVSSFQKKLNIPLEYDLSDIFTSH